MTDAAANGAAGANRHGLLDGNQTANGDVDLALDLNGRVNHVIFLAFFDDGLVRRDVHFSSLLHRHALGVIDDSGLRLSFVATGS